MPPVFFTLGGVDPAESGHVVVWSHPLCDAVRAVPISSQLSPATAQHDVAAEHLHASRGRKIGKPLGQLLSRE